MHFISLMLVFAGVIMAQAVKSQPAQNNNNKFPDLSAPLSIPMYLSGNYGEIRSTHFHAGIDIKTEQVEGKNVLAAWPGYIFRIVVQSGGYGRALYMKHDNGLVTVYAHLQRFDPALEIFVREQQYRKKSFEVDLYPEAGLFAFSGGEIIGISGNSGSSEGPHLHFEVRDAAGSLPLNALTYGLSIRDAVKPRINWLAVYPLDSQSRVNGVNRKLLIQVLGRNGNYYPASADIRVSGNIGFGIEAFDYLDNSANSCSPYTLDMRVDDRLHFLCRFDSIPFSMSGYVNSHIDFAESVLSGKKIQKLYIDPNNRLGIYKTARNRGAVRFTDTAVHRVDIRVKDVYGNETILGFHVTSTGERPILKAGRPGDHNLFRYDSLNVFENADVRVVIPQFALFDDIAFQYHGILTDNNCAAEVFGVHNESTPLFKSYILSVKASGIPEDLRDKAYLASPGKKGTCVSHGGSFKDGFVTARVKAFGRFYVALDTVSPVIAPQGFIKGQTCREDQVLSFLISDLQSGIRSYTGYIDKKWALFEYDGKNDLLNVGIDASRLEKGKTHSLEIVVTDNKENVSRFVSDFVF
jgi:murein DD-endopeptidase MepM/ murein hydrolase activator NlpD